MSVICPYCTGAAELVGGDTVYPHRPDLRSLKFWMCKPCRAYVGCHKKNKKYGHDGTQPLGRLANAELRRAKSRVHTLFDPLWQDGPMSRKEAYAWLAGRMNIPVDECHIGMFDVPMCDRAVSILNATPTPER